MSYEILGSNGGYWTCRQSAWPDYLKVATAFGWAPEGAFFKDDEGGFGPHSSGSYLGNDWQQVTDHDARGFGAALNLAIATVNAGSPMTENQVAALKEFKIAIDDPYTDLAPTTRVVLAKLFEQGRARRSDVVRTIRTHHETFDVNVRRIMDLADVVSAGGFTIA